MEIAKIQRAINSAYRNSKFIIPNVYLFNYYESDILVISQNDLINEFEIKTSRSDFFADFKKIEKHRKLSDKNKKHKPNRFYYICPENLINKDEVPDYAGLIYVSPSKLSSIDVIKKAPLLHNERIDYKKKLFHKIYYRWKDLILKNYLKDTL